MKIKNLAVAVLGLTMVIACNSKKEKNTEQDLTKGGDPVAMKVEIIENYFPKNDIAPNVKQFFTINSQQQFDQKFGVAKTMKNEVEKIDFKKNRIGVILLPKTNKKTSIEIDEAERTGSSAVIEYDISEGEEQSFTSIPALIFKLPADDQLKIIEFKSGSDNNIVNIGSK